MASGAATIARIEDLHSLRSFFSGAAQLVHIRQRSRLVVSREQTRALVIAVLGSSSGLAPRAARWSLLNGRFRFHCSAATRAIYWAVVGGLGVVWEGGGSSVRIPLTHTDPHTLAHTQWPCAYKAYILCPVPPLAHAHSMSNAHAPIAHSAHNMHVYDSQSNRR
jgi:hypothetical protein